MSDHKAFSEYHGELAKYSGLMSKTKKLVKFCGFIAGTGMPVLVEDFLKAENPFIKELAKMGSQKVADIAAKNIVGKAQNPWSPICFGNWYKDEISKFLNSKSNH